MFVKCDECGKRWTVEEARPSIGYTLKHCGKALNFVAVPVETVKVKELV